MIEELEFAMTEFFQRIQNVVKNVNVIQLNDKWKKILI